jgi:hypothetical protein
VMGRELTFPPRYWPASNWRIGAHNASLTGIKALESQRRVPFARTGQRNPTRERALWRESKLREAVSCANSITQAARHWFCDGRRISIRAHSHGKRTLEQYRRFRSEGEPYTQLDTPSSFGCNGPPNRSGGKYGVYRGDISVVQQIGASRIECKRARMVLAAREGEGTAQVRVEMHGSGHRPNVPWDIAIYRVDGEQSKLRAVNPWARPRSVGRPVIEVAIAIRIRACCDVVWRATAGEELGGKLRFQRKLYIAHQAAEAGCLPIHPRRLALFAVARLRIGRP